MYRRSSTRSRINGWTEFVVVSRKRPGSETGFIAACKVVNIKDDSRVVTFILPRSGGRPGRSNDRADLNPRYDRRVNSDRPVVLRPSSLVPRPCHYTLSTAIQSYCHDIPSWPIADQLEPVCFCLTTLPLSLSEERNVTVAPHCLR